MYSQHHHTLEKCANDSLSHEWSWRCTYWAWYCFIPVPPHSQANILCSVQWQRERPVPSLTCILNYLCGIKSFVDPHTEARSQGQLFWMCKTDLGCTTLLMLWGKCPGNTLDGQWTLPQNAKLHSRAYKLCNMVFFQKETSHISWGIAVEYILYK